LLVAQGHWFHLIALPGRVVLYAPANPGAFGPRRRPDPRHVRRHTFAATGAEWMIARHLSQNLHMRPNPAEP